MARRHVRLLWILATISLIKDCGMHHNNVSPFFLHGYDGESGLWASMTLGSPVSPRLAEAMNLILQKDGILAYIGTRSEFGHYLSELKNETGKDFRHCWTSLPASTIMSMLGLCQCTGNPRKPEVVFYGSPLTLMLAYMLDMKEDGLDHMVTTRDRDNLVSGYILETSMQLQIGAISDVHILASEYQEALSYIQE